MSDFSFRIRFVRSPSDTINIDSNSVHLEFGHASETVTLSSAETGKSIRDARRLALRGSGWSSLLEAETAGNRYKDALMIALARIRVGADFGDRAPKSGLTQAGRAMMEGASGIRILNDVHGLTVFETELKPQFVSVGRPTLTVGMSEKEFRTALELSVKHVVGLSERERLSLELFNASFFQQSADARFLMLILAIEALLEPVQRSNTAVAHVEQLIELTKVSELLSQADKDSIRGSLNWLKVTSIGQMGRNLAQERLGSRTYLGLSAPKFFSHCYELRSRLVHGSTSFPTQDELGRVAATLEVFVSDLITAPILPLESD